MSEANEYTFQGDGVHASYFPDGSGPETGNGRVTFSYQDAHQSMVFFGTESVVSVVGVGTLVTVVLSHNEISHAQTSFTVIIPSIGVDSSPQAFKTKAITTTQGATLVQREVFPALQSYKVEHLDGAAVVAQLAD